MKQHPDPGIPVLHCKGCKSLWFGRGVLETVLAELEAQEPEMDENDRPIPPAKRVPQAVEYRKCPSCADPMKRENYQRISGIVIDTCLKHGTFLDAGELEALKAFIQAGGQAAAQQQQTEEEQRQDRAKMRQAAHDKERRQRNLGRTSGYDFNYPKAPAFSLWDMLTGSDDFFRPK